MQCQNCGQDFYAERWWQVFCSKQCRGAWHRLQQRKAELAAAKLDGNGHANGGGVAVEAHRAKWAAIRAEWAEEDGQEAQRKFPRRARAIYFLHLRFA